MPACIVIASDFSGLLMMLQFPVSGIFCLIGAVLFCVAAGRSDLARICFAASIAVTGGTALCEISGESTAFDGKHWDFLLLLVSPALVSGIFLTISLLFQRPRRAKNRQ